MSSVEKKSTKKSAMDVVKKVFKDTNLGVEKEAKKAVKDTEKEAKRVAKEAEKEAKRVAKEAKRVAKEAKDTEKEAKRAAKEAKMGAEKETKRAAIDPDEILIENPLIKQQVETFCFRKTYLQSLSNFSPHKVELDGIMYPTGEHAFQASKFLKVAQHTSDPSRKQLLIDFASKFTSNSLSSFHAKNLGKSGLSLSTDELSIWMACAIVVQNNICQYKFLNFPSVRLDLLSSKDKTLVHSASRCDDYMASKRIWEGKPVIQNNQLVILGQNILGDIWMSYRNSIFT